MTRTENFSESATRRHTELCRGQFGATLAKNAQAQARLNQATGLQDLVELQGALFRQHCTASAAYWAELAAVARRMQAEMAAVVVREQAGAGLGSVPLSPAAAKTGSGARI